jgi:hypothetical protein
LTGASDCADAGAAESASTALLPNSAKRTATGDKDAMV